MPDVDRSSHADLVARGRIELIATVLLAFATVLTAWSAFQSTKWSGTQAIHFARAGALRTESAKASDSANSARIIDVQTFVSWAGAVAEERQLDPTSSTGADGSYEPNPEALSGFLFARFRDEFGPAVEAWLSERPLTSSDASPTPFTLPEYQLADEARARDLETRADHEAELARRDNQRGDNYVLTTVLFASVLFFAGVSSKLDATRNRLAAIGLAVLLLVSGIGIVVTFPVTI